MTDRHAGYVVTLDKDIREDDAAGIISALGMVKGVASVEPVIADASLVIATARAKSEFKDKFYGFYVSLFERAWDRP